MTTHIIFLDLIILLAIYIITFYLTKFLSEKVKNFLKVWNAIFVLPVTILVGVSIFVLNDTEINKLYIRPILNILVWIIIAFQYRGGFLRSKELKLQRIKLLESSKELIIMILDKKDSMDDDSIQYFEEMLKQTENMLLPWHKRTKLFSIFRKK